MAVARWFVLLSLCIAECCACNTAEELEKNAKLYPFHNGLSGHYDSELRSAPLVLLPQDNGDESPACLDGSPYGFYFQPSQTNSTKWTISIEGGGWCYDEDKCFQRSKMKLGSSKEWAKVAGCRCMNALPDGTMDNDCNCIYMPYGDGASFSGYRPKPWPVPGQNASLYFRGIKNFDATMSFAFRHGLDKATEFVLTGGSAGGLSTFLHADRIRQRLLDHAPSCRHIVAAPIVGYFLDHANIRHDADNYTAWMAYIYHMQNLTFGGDGGLTESCRSSYPEDQAYYCFMSPHMQKVIKTPFFMFNSKYDAWQMGNELQVRPPYTDPKVLSAILQYGEDFLHQFAPVESESKNGAMITSCICHGCSWDTLSVNGKTADQHYADWYTGKTHGVSAIHIDTSLPNGNGTFTDPRCTPFNKTTLGTGF